MYTVKNLTNSPHKIQTVDGFARLGAREEAEIDVLPSMVRRYSQLGYLVLTKITDTGVDSTEIDNAELAEVDQVESQNQEESESEAVGDSEQESEEAETTHEADESEEEVEASDEEAKEPEPAEVELTDPEPEVAEVNSEEAAEEEKAEELDEKDVLIAQLKDLGVKADKRSSVKKLQEKLDEALAK